MNDDKPVQKLVALILAIIVVSYVASKIINPGPSTLDESKIFAPSTNMSVRQAIESAEIQKGAPLTADEIESISARTIFSETHR